ncbi:MAG: isopenicillin N synthase family dioxygenase [Bradymonadia bacterium]
MKQTIPVVDLNDFRRGSESDRAAFIKCLGEAFVEYGFVAIENHGVDRQALVNAYQSMRALFDLSEVQKSKYESRRTGRQRGYTPFGKERAKDASAGDLKEFWHVGPELPPGDVLRHRIPDNIWPLELPEFREHSVALWQSLHDCGFSLLEALALFLDAPADTFTRMLEGGNTVLRMIRYPEPKAGEDGIWAAAHEDINLITLLVEATEPGLELQTRDGRWLPITPVPGQLIADTGDMMQRLTNGFIPATTHRVCAPPAATGPRYSIPFFMHPHPDALLKPLASCLIDGTACRYPLQTAEEYLGKRLRDNGVLTMDADADWVVGGTIDEEIG